MGQAEQALTPEMQALADEAMASPLAGDTASDDGARSPDATAAPPAQIETAQMIQLLAPGVAALGNMACDALRVTRLEGDEVMQLAGALGNLAEAYNVMGQLDPKSAAWLALAAVSAGVVARRRRVVTPSSPAEEQQPTA